MHIATPPNILKFDDPAICIDNDNDTQCNSYYVQNMMLGNEITLPACVLDYYDNPILDSTQFIIDSETHSNYFLTGPKHILISCDIFRGISIKGNQSLSKSNANFSINISLNVDHSADWKQIAITLIVGLSPCHLELVSGNILDHINVNVIMLMILCFVLVIVQLLREVTGLVL